MHQLCFPPSGEEMHCYHSYTVRKEGSRSTPITSQSNDLQITNPTRSSVSHQNSLKPPLSPILAIKDDKSLRELREIKCWKECMPLLTGGLGPGMAAILKTSQRKGNHTQVLHNDCQAVIPHWGQCLPASEA